MLKQKYGSTRVEKKGISAFITNKKEKWPAFGQEYRYIHAFIKKFSEKPFLHLKKIKKEKPKIMVLGAGLGVDLIEFKKALNLIKINPTIDVLSLTKSLSPRAKKIVNKDYSQNKAIETIDFKKETKLASNLKSKYDLVVAPLSVGVYTDHPSYNMFLTSLMLNKNGKAYIELGEFKLKTVTRFKKFVEIYNLQNKTDYKFTVNKINPNEEKYLEITRLR